MSTATPTHQENLNTLRATITDIDALSQSGFSEISALAKLLIVSLEHPSGYRNIENIAQTLQVIWHRAEDIENCINSEAENVGCNWKDETHARRYAAYREFYKGETA